MMEINNGELGQGDALVPRTLDRLLLDETNHRVANEVTSALAAMRLARSAKGQHVRNELIHIAVNRLEGFGECARIFASANAMPTNAGALVEQVCRAMMRSRLGPGPERVLLDLRELVVDGETARRIAMISYELVTNALKHAFQRTGGELDVRLHLLGGNIVLSVIDDGPGLGPGGSSVTTGNRLGGRIVGDLVRASCGTMECRSGPKGTAVHVMLPKVPAL